MNRSRIIETYPLSPMQQGMFFHTDYDQPAGFYIQQMVCTLGEDLDVSALHKAWQRVIDRHPIFRTAFRWDVDGPHQEVHESLAVAFQREDWREKSEEEQTARLHQYLESDRRQGFQPGEPPLMHVALFRWADSAYRMIWTFHHALLDGRSHYLVLREVFTLYEAYRSGHNVELKDPRPYRDYIRWLGQRDGSRDKQFWRQRLEGFCSPSPLVFDGAPVEARPSYHGLPEIRLDKDITFALRSLAKRHDLTLNTLVQGTWALLLSHYSGAGDVIFGATRACRRSTFADAGEMIGMFINTLPVRARVNQGMCLIQWLKDLRQQNIEVRDYEHTPLVKIQNWSELSNTVPLFDSILVFENYEINDSLRARGGTWKNREFRLEEKSNYPVVVAAYAGAELLVKVQYDRKRFTDAAIASVLTQFQTLLGAFLSAPAENLSCGDIMRDLVNRPDEKLAGLPLMTEAERRKLLTDWKGSRTDFPKEACIHELFAQRAERTPDATAVVFEDYELSYGELNRRANQLGHYLKQRGVGPDVLVGICVERSIEMLVGLLGILKAGGAYVPLDPRYPAERLAMMLQDARVSVLVTQEKFREKFSKHVAQLICLDSAWPEIAKESRENPATTTTAENLAYVIYTSGSTGKPKGVCVPHRGPVRLVSNTNFANFDADQIFLQFAPISFDASTFEVWGSLLNGARLVVMPPGLPSLGELGAVLQRRKVTTLWLTAGLFQQMVDAQLESLRGLRQLLAGGDVLSVAHVEKVTRELKGCQLINGYGPTENTTFTCCYRAKPDERLLGSVPIGHPISNTEVYILDGRLEPTPVGIAGSLYIGGDGLARGYLNDPELTAEKFIPHPFNDQPGARLYETGDQARFLPDGTVEFLGRADNQVKIRGYRIELGEIEATLGRYPGVDECAVLARGDGSVDKRLVAYVVTQKEQAPEANGLRAFLQTQLPDYMVPAQFVSLSEMPLTPNGKLDRRALPSPEKSRSASADSFVEPRTETEKELAAMWRELLEREQVGIHDNFFELGGHSLLATQVVSRVYDAFQARLSLRTFFEKPTVAALAEFVAGAKKESAETMSPIRRLRRDELPAITLDQGQS